MLTWPRQFKTGIVPNEGRIWHATSGYWCYIMCLFIHILLGLLMLYQARTLLTCYILIWNNIQKMKWNSRGIKNSPPTGLEPAIPGLHSWSADPVRRPMPYPLGHGGSGCVGLRKHILFHDQTIVSRTVTKTVICRGKFENIHFLSQLVKLIYIAFWNIVKIVFLCTVVSSVV